MSTPYAKLLVRVDGGAPQDGGVTITEGQTIQFVAESTAGWEKARWEIVGPPGWSVPAGWTNEGGAAVYLGATESPPSWTAPADAATGWGKWIPSLVVNDSMRVGTDGSPTFDSGLTDADGLGLSMLSPEGFEDVSPRETTQFGGALRQWAGGLQNTLRTLSTAIAGVVAGSQFVVSVKLAENVSVGDVACSANDAVDPTIRKRATAANLANGDVCGVFIENGTTGQTKLMAGPGAVLAPSVLGIASSAQRDFSVLNTTTARVARKTTPVYGDEVVGITDKQGNTTVAPIPARRSAPAHALLDVPVYSAAATRSWTLVGDGTNVRVRQEIPNLLDELPPGTDPTNVTDWIAYLDAFTIRAKAAGHGKIPYIGVFYKISRPWVIADDNTHGNLADFTIIVEQGMPTGVQHNAIAPQFVDFSGHAAHIATVTNGGSGQVMMQITETGLSTSDAASCVDQPIEISGSTVNANNVVSMVCKADSDGTLYVYNPNGGATADDGWGGGAGVGNGKIVWRVRRAAIEIRARGVRFENGPNVIAATSGMLTTLVRIRQSNGAGSRVVNRVKLIYPYLTSYNASHNVYRWRYGIEIGESIVPLSGHSGYATNGSGIPQVYNPGNVSECEFWHPYVTYSIHGSALCGMSKSGQSEQNAVRFGQFEFVRHIWTNPSTGFGANAAHCDFWHGKIGQIYDTAYDAAPSARPMRVVGDVLEPGVGARLFNVALNVGNAFYFTHCSGNLQTPHPSGELGRVTGEGLSKISENWLLGANADEKHFYFQAAGSYGEVHCHVVDNLIRGTTTWTAEPAILTGTNRGPWPFTDGETLIFETAAGVPQTLTLTAAAIGAAAGVTISNYELRAWELGKFINANLTGAKAWGDEDDQLLTIRSTTLGASGYVKCNGGTFNTKLGLSTVAKNGSAAFHVCTDTGGYLTSNITTPNACVSYANRHVDAGTGNIIPVMSFRDRHMGTTKTGASWAAAKRGTVTHTAGGTTFSFTFATANLPDEPDTAYNVRAVPVQYSALVAHGGDQVITVTKATNKIDFAVAADPTTGDVTFEVEVWR